jgi:hypothetical protein
MIEFFKLGFSPNKCLAKAEFVVYLHYSPAKAGWAA